MTDDPRNPLFLVELVRGLQGQLIEMARANDARHAENSRRLDRMEDAGEARHKDNLDRFEETTKAIGEFKAAVAPVPKLVTDVNDLKTDKARGLGVILGIGLLGGSAGGTAAFATLSKVFAKWSGG